MVHVLIDVAFSIQGIIDIIEGYVPLILLGMEG